jgi:hypothetical protein
MTCKCIDLETRLAEALDAANGFRTQRDELRLKIEEGIRVKAINRGAFGAMAAFATPVYIDSGNATLILDAGIVL